MQYRYTLPVKKDVLSVLERFLRLVVFSAVLVSLYLHVTSEKFAWDPGIISKILYSPLCWTALALMPANIAMESWKWHLIVKSGPADSSFSNSCRGVLAGLACGLVTPRALGEYAGRIAVLSGENKLAYAGPLAVSRISQLSVTLLFGSAGVAHVFGPVWACITVILAPVLLVATFVLMKYWRFPGRSRVQVFLDGLKGMDRELLIRICLLSTGRYMVFALQFILVLAALSTADISLIVLGVSWIFLAKSVLPSVNFLGDLGLREVSAVWFFAAANVETAPVIAGSLLIWSINIGLPACAGSLLLLARPR